MKQTKELKTNVVFEIPRKDLDIYRYRTWLDKKVRKWLIGEGNPQYRRISPGQEWNIESRFSAITIGGKYIYRGKIYMLDGDSDTCFFQRRGVWFSDHDDKIENEDNIQHISDNFEQFLTREDINHNREDF